MRTTMPADGRCIECRRPMSPCTHSKKPLPGTVRHRGRGRCVTCRVREQKRRQQPPGTPRARQVSREVLHEEVPMLREVGTPEWQIAERLGMKPLSYKRALLRAGLSAGPIERNRAA